jgi:transcriptional regulator of acetoin/glycerol metabolism
VRGVAAPVRDYSGQAVAAITITGPASRITRNSLPRLAAHVIKAAENISSRLGYSPKPKRAADVSQQPVRLVAQSRTRKDQQDTEFKEDQL